MKEVGTRRRKGREGFRQKEERRRRERGDKRRQRGKEGCEEKRRGNKRNVGSRKRK